MFFVVHTHPSCEELAQQELAYAGVTTFLPTVDVESRLGRHRYIRKEPVFPSYLFAQLNLKLDNWHAISLMRGIKRLLGCPTPLSEESVAELMHRNFTPTPTTPVEVKIGDRVMVTTGSFSRHFGTCTIARRDRVSLLMELFGGKVDVELPRDFVVIA